MAADTSTRTTTAAAAAAPVAPAGEGVAPAASGGWRGSRRMVLFVLTLSFFSDAFMWGVVLPVLPFSLTERAGVAPEDVQRIVSQSLSIFSAAGVIACPIFGIISDRFGTRKMPFILGLACLLVATILLATATSVAQVMVARLLQGLSAASVWVAGLAMLQDAVGGKELGSALGTCFAWVTLGELISPPAGGWIYHSFGYWAVWQVCSALIAVDLLARLFLREPKTPRYGDAPGKKPRTHSHTYGSTPAPPIGATLTAIARIEDPQHRIAHSNGGASTASDESQPLLLTGHHTASSSLPATVIDDNDVEDGEGGEDEHNTWLERVWPIAKLHRTARFNAALLNGFSQAVVISAIESTMPLHVHRLFGFDSMQAGILFLPLVLPGVILGPILGNLADKRGARFVTMRGFLFLAPGLAFFCVPGAKWFDALWPHSWTAQPTFSHFPFISPSVALFSFLLLFVGLGYPAISSPSLLETSQAVEDYQREHGEDVFGYRGPYASLYAMNNIVFFAGLTVGPMFGALSDAIGFGRMTLLLAAYCLLMSISCATFLPSVRPVPQPRQRRRRQRTATQE
ncbi:hypothetical protein OC834_006201 [Tilletia horrida]|nr:hypothetical protein OC834_006201 [Tilletia horrida]